MTLKQQAKQASRMVWLAIKYKIRYRIFRPFYRKIVEMKDEQYNKRKVDVLTLECGHMYWKEKERGEFHLKPPVQRLCDSCFRMACVKELGESKGAVWFGRWERMVKGR